MRLFPDEERRIEEVRRKLATQFEFADRLFGFWLHAPKDKWLSASRLPPNVKHVAMMLNVQAVRQFRSVVEESRRAEAIGANIIARSLYETAVALLFILKPHVRITASPANDKDGKHKVDADGTLRYQARPLRKNEKARKCPSRELRANLYLVKPIITAPRFFDRMSTIPGIKRFGKSRAAATRKVTTELVTAYHKKIGPEWWSVLQHSSSYSGLGVEALTQIVDGSHSLDRWYQTVYRAQSDIAHAADAGIHSEITSDDMLRPRFMSSEDEICGALQEGVVFLLVCMNTCQKYIGFGPGVEMAMRGFFRDFRGVFFESFKSPVAAGV